MRLATRKVINEFINPLGGMYLSQTSKEVSEINPERIRSLLVH